MNWGAGSCPCVESIQGSTLMPVHVEREVRLLARNLHLFQVSASCSQVPLWPLWLLQTICKAWGARRAHGPRSLSHPALCWGPVGLASPGSWRCPDSHVFHPQDSPGDNNECVMELEGREVVVQARVECEPPPGTRCHVTCQRHQVQVKTAWVGKDAWPRAGCQLQLVAPHSSQLRP